MVTSFARTTDACWKLLHLCKSLQILNLKFRAGRVSLICQVCWHIWKYTDEKGKFDELVEDKGVKILIDPKALMHVIGTKMDFVDDKLRYIYYFNSC